MVKGFGKNYLKHNSALLVVLFCFAGVQAAKGADVPDVERLTIEALLEKYKIGAFSAEDVTKATLARIKKYEPSYNAFTFIAKDALEQARTIDKRRAAGEKLGPLAGVPYIIKESIDTKGIPSTAGWAALNPDMGGVALIPARDATLVARLRAAGAIIIGKGNIPQFSMDGAQTSYSWAGRTYNVAHRETLPGGSSSGVAAAVAAGFAVAGIGEETGGSIQNPAAAQGLVGLKPTLGLVPSSGLLPIAGSTGDVAGPIAKTVYDVAATMDVIVGYTAEDTKTLASVGNTPRGGYVNALGQKGLRGGKLGLYGPGWSGAPLSEDVQQLYAASVAEVKKLGALTAEKPFEGSGFKSLLGMEMFHTYYASLLYDLDQYLRRFSNDDNSYSAMALKQQLGFDPASNSRVSAMMQVLRSKDSDSLVEIFAQFLSRESFDVPEPAAADYTTPPDLSAYVALRERYLAIFNRVMDENGLNALVFPQILAQPPEISEHYEHWPATTVPFINFLGLPVVTVPAGEFSNGAPYAIVFVGRMWSEAELLSLAYDYEQATKHRKTPMLVKVTP